MAEKKFEAALSRLEEIVKELEAGELPLEQSLKLFEEGIKLSRVCNKRLEDAERALKATAAEPHEPSVHRGTSLWANGPPAIAVPLGARGERRGDGGNQRGREGRKPAEGHGRGGGGLRGRARRFQLEGPLYDRWTRLGRPGHVSARSAGRRGLPHDCHA